MTWKERRTITILSAILAILCVALLIVLGIKYRASRAEDAAENDGQADAGLIAAQNEYTALSYNNGSATLSFSLDEEGTWVWSDDPAFPLDDTAVTAILSELSSLTPQQTITDGDTLENYGLTAPAATLTAATAEGETLTLALGKATTDGDSYYMLMNDDESTVYIIADTLYNYMQTAIYDMMLLPELPELTEDVIDTITIQGASSDDGTAGLITLLAAQHSEEGTTWRSDGVDVTGNETVQALLSDLASLSLSQCVDYRPSDEAVTICGFDSPDAVLTVAYTGASGESGTLTLYIGNSAVSGDGRYVRLEDDSTIYLLPTASLDPLMRVSVSGLGEA